MSPGSNNADRGKCSGLETPLTECLYPSAVENSVASASRNKNLNHAPCFDKDGSKKNSAAGKMIRSGFKRVIRFRSVYRRPYGMRRTRLSAAERGGQFEKQ